MAEELAHAKKGLAAFAVAQHGEVWSEHFSGKAKKAIWRELTDDGKDYPSLGTFYLHVRQSSLQSTLTRYFDYQNLSTVIRVLHLTGSELQLRLERVRELERLLEAKNTYARQQAVA